jgi:hypothetical protein
MGIARQFTPEKLVMGILISAPEKREELFSALTESWGPRDYQSAPIPFTFTDYYDEEMGGPIERQFIAFRDLVDPATLADIKIRTNALEERFRDAGGRRVNLDPGLMALPRFTLATTKENAHRIPLTRGIYAEVTLLYGKGGFHALPWTYPDFRSDEYLSILNEIRGLYKNQTRPS